MPEDDIFKVGDFVIIQPYDYGVFRNQVYDTKEHSEKNGRYGKIESFDSESVGFIEVVVTTGEKIRIRGDRLKIIDEEEYAVAQVVES